MIGMGDSRQALRILLDLDGTLVDSSAVVRRVMERWCLRHGLGLDAVLAGCPGERTEDTVARVAPHLCAKSEAAEIEAEENRSLDGLQPVAGAGQFLASLDAGRWGVVTSSTLASARLKLHACGLPLPEVMITAESVSRGKPHPEPFLMAADALGARAEDCLVFEDAENGARSALAAGCRVILIGDSCGIRHERVLGRITSFEEIVDLPSGVE